MTAYPLFPGRAASWLAAPLAAALIGCGAVPPGAVPTAATPAAHGVIVRALPGFQPPAGAIAVMPEAGLWLVDAATPAAQALPAWQGRAGVAEAWPNAAYQVMDAGAPRARGLRVSQASGGTPWNLAQIRVPDAWTYQAAKGFPPQGKGITVAVLDTGIDPGHPALVGVALPMIDAWNEMHPNLPANPVPCSASSQATPSADVCTFKGQTYNWTGKDGNGHGTHVSGILAAQQFPGPVQGVAPQVRLLPIKVANFQGGTDAATLLKGINDALDRGAKVISVSIGGSSDQDGSLVSPNALREGVAAAIRRGAIFAAANGNEGNRTPVDLPAAYDDVIAVAATTKIGTIGDYSNTGPETTLAAPGGAATAAEGGGILSTWPTYLTADDLAHGEAAPHNTESLAGTSMSTPHVAGVAALLLAQEPNLTPQQVRVRLAGTAAALNSNGFDVFSGFGQIDALRAVDRRGHDAR